MEMAQAAAKIFGMSEEVWRRHANPWSGWSRAVTGLPLICLAIWSRDWIGQGAWIALAVTVFWLWLNPRLFPAPERFDTWMSRGVLGEKIYIEHRDDIDPAHLKICKLLQSLSLPGVVIMGIGLWRFWPDWVIFGAILGALPKFWFLDRMVWILSDWEKEGRSPWRD